MSGRLGVLVLLLCQSAWSLMVARCPNGWESRGGTDQCYRVHNYGNDRTFNDARTYCQARGGDLAYIDTPGLRDWLGQLMASTGDVGQNAYMWVGAKNVDGTWIWIETSQPVDNFILPWEGTNSGNCAALTLNSKLIKQDCSGKLKFICHRNIQIPSPCNYDAGWEEQNQLCYKRSDNSDSWNDALVECDITGGMLASIMNEAENQLAHDFAIDTHDNIWIGLTEEGHAGDFQWVDGSNVTFTKWQPDQPDLSLTGHGAAVVDKDDPDGLWVVEKVTEEFHYLCKKPQGSCLPGWEVFEDSCYYFNTEQDDKVVWDDAMNTCKDVGASLVVLDNQREDEFYHNHIPETDTLWIGLYSDPAEDEFLWLDESDINSKNFTHMSDQDYTNGIYADIRQCVFFQILETISSWVPTDCFSPRHYACEVPAGQPITLIPPSQERYCPEGWPQEGDYCYQFLSDEKTWPSAHKYCAQHQAELVSIVTWAEQDFVHNNQMGGGHLGFNDQKTDHEWVWSDGSSVLITNWNTGEPSGGTENCAEMIGDSGKWNDIHCDLALPYTCKRKASTSPIGVITTTTSLPDYSTCGHGWTENIDTGECYRLELEELSFDDSRLHCRELHYDEDKESRPDLVSIYSSLEQNFIFNLMSLQHLSQSVIWMGLKNSYDDGIHWTDGTPCAFFNWNDGEPNGAYFEECIEMYTSTGKWNDGECNLRHAFICEKKGVNYVGPQLPPPPEVVCPADWSYFDNHCYYLSTDYVDWDTANSRCASNMDSSLASLTHQDENDYVKGMLDVYWASAWLGLHDDNNVDNWYWTDGSPYSWTNWGDGEPNHADGNEHCGEIRVDGYLYDGEWNDQVCSIQNQYICKMAIKTCPRDWTYDNGKCYYASDYGATWHEAQDNCKEVNTEAELISIHSEEENTFFMNLQSQASTSTWLGLTYFPNTTSWVWSDGQDKGYENWNGGEPNNLDTELCGEMIDFPGGFDNGMWNNLDCTETRSFGCESFPTHTVGCEDGWMNYEKYCYWYSNSDYMYYSYTYDQAQTECQNKGAKLASIHTQGENDFVYSMFESYSYTGTWIGMNDNGHSGSLAWTDDTAITYTNFDILDSYAFSTYPTCASFSAYDYYFMGLWYLSDCYTYSYFVCKKPQETIPINPPDAGCQGDDMAYKISCYNFNQAYLSWSRAKDDCDSKGTYLVVLNDRYETAFVSAMLAEVEGHAWIGMSGTIAGDGSVSFSWVNGDEITFTNWDEYEPAPDHGTCVAASGESTNLGFWSVRNCDDTFQYICEYSRKGYTTPAPITTKPPGSYCLSGWEHKGTRCYKVLSQLATRGQGEQFCASFMGHLVSIESAEEESIITGLPGMDELSEFNKLWTGLKMGTDSGYEWSDGTPFSYVNWDTGEPDTNGGRETCVSADWSTLKLMNSYCDTHLPFICEAAEGTMVTTVGPPTTPETQKCKDDDSWFLYEDYCYKFVSESDEAAQDWWESHRLCHEDGGELVSIHTVEENYWIEAMIYQKSDSVLWIGGRAKLDQGYQWSDSTGFDFDNWADGEPNNVESQEDCISMYTHKQGYWNDQNCGNTVGRICKRPHGKTHPPIVPTQPPPGHCPSGWVHTGTKCIQINTMTMAFNDARTFCTQQGTDIDLASIHSPAEEAYLMSALAVIGKNMWLGMSYVDGFHWVDQTSVTYTNWAPGEPNGGASGEFCVHVYSDSGKWNDVNCYNAYGFICMMVQDPSLNNHHPFPSCPAPFDQYMVYKGACYRPVSTPKTWEDAESTCAEDGAHMVSILSATESSFTWVTAMESSFTDTWIGLNNLVDHQVYRWSDGWSAVITNWGPGQPTVNLTAAHCVSLTTSDGLWYNQKCDQTKPFICKYSNESVVTADPPTTGHCPDTRWVDLGGSYCYLISDQTQNWNDANRNCLQESAQMVSIHSEEELQLINMATSSLINPFWIGLLQQANGYGWSDGTGFDFINWENGEPNSEDEECGEQFPMSGHWNDAWCDNYRKYLCKILKIQDVEPTNVPPSTTPRPGGGGDGTGGLSSGTIAGIVIGVLFVMAGVGFMGYSFVQKQPKKVEQITNPGTHSFDTILINGGKAEPKTKGVTSIVVDNLADGTEA